MTQQQNGEGWEGFIGFLILITAIVALVWSCQSDRKNCPKGNMKPECGYRAPEPCRDYLIQPGYGARTMPCEWGHDLKIEQGVAYCKCK